MTPEQLREIVSRIRRAKPGADWEEAGNLIEGYAHALEEVERLTARVLELEPDAERWDALAEIWCHAVELSLTQDEDGAWSITIVEPVEATIGHGRWTGDTPETAIDAARGSKP